jgi:hypothetical protein
MSPISGNTICALKSPIEEKCIDHLALAYPSQDVYLTPFFFGAKSFEILNPYAKATSGENEKSEKILFEFGHPLC